MKNVVSGVVLMCCTLSMTAQAEYDFNPSNRNHMRGAWLMCASRGFEGSDCQRVFAQCHRPPMIYLRRHRDHYHTTSHCVKAPDFSVEEGDVDRALGEATSE